ncbi:MAG TPA: hypothetical protein VII14_19055 [Xanthobacteraceae bacterium]
MMKSPMGPATVHDASNKPATISTTTRDMPHEVCAYCREAWSRTPCLLANSATLW